jgi:hypothetical protein
MTGEQENFISRRAVLPIAAGALASVAVIPAVAAQPSELAALIEAHRAAYDAFNEFCGREDEVRDAYKAAYSGQDIMVPCLLGGGYDLRLGEESIREQITRRYERQRENLKELARVDSRAADKLLAKLEGKEVENLALVPMALEKEEARQEAFGLTAVLREYDTLNEAEEAALIAVCACVPRSPEEGRSKAAYLKHMHDRTDGLQDWHIDALLQSIAGGASV